MVFDPRAAAILWGRFSTRHSCGDRPPAWPRLRKPGTSQLVRLQLCCRSWQPPPRALSETGDGNSCSPAGVWLLRMIGLEPALSSGNRNLNRLDKLAERGEHWRSEGLLRIGLARNWWRLAADLLGSLPSPASPDPSIAPRHQAHRPNEFRLSSHLILPRSIVPVFWAATPNTPATACGWLQTNPHPPGGVNASPAAAHRPLDEAELTPIEGHILECPECAERAGEAAQ